MAPLKPVLLAGLAFSAVASCAGDSCETGDQTALLQSHLSRKSDMSLSQHSAQSAAFFPKLSSLNDPHTRKAALLEIEKTAVKLASMDKSEATPVVIEVCLEVAGMLNETVLAAIIDEDQTDRAALQNAYDGFQQWEDQRAAAEAQLLAAEAIVTERAEALVECRAVEEQTCINETICTTEVDADCLRVEELERRLQEKDQEIHEAWCDLGASGPEIRQATSFRQGTVITFIEYKTIWDELAEAMGLCDDATEHCETTTATYITQATSCNTKQAQLQQASCEYHHVASGALLAYQQGYDAALAFYNDIVAQVMIREADRKVEWEVITRVVCLLLTLTNEDDGVVSSAETNARIERCWDDFVDVSHLDIDYLEPPPKLSLPELPPLPCTSEYDDEYDLGEPAACTALVAIHNTQATSECTCLADELANQGIMLGHYLFIDPALDDISINAGNEWSATIEGLTYTGPMSSISTQDFTSLSSEMLTDSQLDPTDIDYTGPIHSIAYAYPSEAAVAAWDGTAMNLAQRFAKNGGLLFLNADNLVIEARELADSSGPLGQPVSATLSFSSAEEVTAAQTAAACPVMQPISPSAQHYAQGARHYCWVMGAGIPQCLNGCFIYETSGNDHMVFPLIEGLHITTYQ